MRVKRQKFFILLLTAILLFGVFETPVKTFAASTQNDGGIQPLYTNLQLLSVGFAVDQEAGEAIAGILVSYYNNTDYIAILVDFQRKENDEWKHYRYTLTRIDESPSDWETSISIEPGYYYRAVVTVRLYANQSTAETVTLESKVEYY